MLSLLSVISQPVFRWILVAIVTTVPLYVMNNARINANRSADLARQQLSEVTTFNDNLKQTIDQLRHDADKSSAAMASEMESMRSRIAYYNKLRGEIKNENGCVGPATATVVNGLRRNKDGVGH